MSTHFTYTIFSALPQASIDRKQKQSTGHTMNGADIAAQDTIKCLVHEQTLPTLPQHCKACKQAYDEAVARSPIRIMILYDCTGGGSLIVCALTTVQPLWLLVLLMICGRPSSVSHALHSGDLVSIELRPVRTKTVVS